MGFDFDTSELSQSAARKITSHDNCTVLDVGSGSFPRYIEVRLPDDDGSRQTALWDGSLNLQVNDGVLCHEYAGSAVWRVASVGGADSGAGKVRVSKVWASDFTSESLVTDASDNVTINTGTLTLPSDIIHLNNIITRISFADDEIEFIAGDISMLKLTETTQDLVEIGDVDGGGDVDIDFNSGQMFLQGSSGFFGVGKTPTVLVDAEESINGVSRIALRNTNAGNVALALLQVQNDASAFFQAGMASSAHANSLLTNKAIFQSNGADLLVRAIKSGGFIQFNGGVSGTVELARLQDDKHVGFSVSAPTGQIHAYDAISGFLNWEYDGLDGTVRTVVPNGAGDVLYGLAATYVLRDSATALSLGTTTVANGAFADLVVGTNTVRLRVNADGSCDTFRTAGTDTIKVGYVLKWL